MKQFFTFSLMLFSGALMFQRCDSNDVPKVNCEDSDLVLELTGTNPVDCASTGSIEISVTGGKGPFTYSVDAGSFGANNLFTGIIAGSHVARVKDGKGCIFSEEIELTVPSSTLDIGTVTVAEVSGCKTNNGELNVAVTGGLEPYTYSKDNVDYSNTTGVFTNLAAGTYTIFVKDDEGCTTSQANVRVRTGISYENDIKPILQANCIKSGCHNGDNGSARNWSVFANVKANAANIKERTGNGSMPEDNPLPQNERDLIACWVDDGALAN